MTMTKHQSNRGLFLTYLAQTSDMPMMVEVSRAENIYLYAPNEKEYIDLISGIAVSTLGHNHSRIVKAVQEQAGLHMHVMVYGEFIQGPQVKLAEALANTLPEKLNNVYFVNSGSEAIEGAIKLARRFTGRHELVACKNAYHGATNGALSLSDNEYFKQAFMPLLPGVRHISFNKEKDLETITDKTAAVIIETVQGEAGVRIADKSYFSKLRARCDQTGTLLVLDEIQTGFGRTGTFWGFEQYGITPDIIVSAKGMGGGMPLGAFIAPDTIMKVLQDKPVLGHITTFGGHPVSCAASLATLTELTETRIYQKAGAKGELFKKLLQHPRIKGIRQIGLMIAVEFESAGLLRRIIGKAVEYGIITDWFLFCDNAMRIAPPLVITEEQIKVACERLLKAIDEG